LGVAATGRREQDSAQEPQYPQPHLTKG
jgi:hypothetical protein